MATVRTGDRPVLLVVDVQVGVMEGAWDAARVVENVACAVQRARRQRVPVIWVQHTDDELVPGSAPWQWVSALVPAQGERAIHKRFNSSFEQTPLEGELARLGATRIVLAGAATNWCIRATAYGALERGYDLTLLHDAHTTHSLALPGGERVDAAGIVAELNTTLSRLSYPGRTNSTAPAREVDFGAVAPAPRG